MLVNCCEPLVPLVPAHEPLAVQVVELVLLQVSVALPPTKMDVGLTEIVTVGAGAAGVATENVMVV